MRNSCNNNMRSSGDNSYIYSSGCKLEDDEVTVMKFTNDSRLNQLDLKQIDGLQPQIASVHLTLGTSLIVIETLLKISMSFRRGAVMSSGVEKSIMNFNVCVWIVCLLYFYLDSKPYEESPSTVVKISKLSILGSDSRSKHSPKISMHSMSPGSKFSQRVSKISNNVVEQFMRHKRYLFLKPYFI